MKFNRHLIMALLLVLIMCTGASANKLSVTGFVIDDDSLMSYRTLYEVASTNDTLTTTESGKVFLPNISSGNITFTLPTAAAGLTYTFTAINGSATSLQGYVVLDPTSADTFVGCVSSSAETTFAADDRLRSPNATGDSVTIVGASGKWYCINRIGTWVDHN